MTNPDFVLLAQAMGVHAIRCNSAEELPAKMKEFLEYDNSKPVVMECIVEKDEHVFPMVRFPLPCIEMFRACLTDGWLFVRYLPARLSTSSCSILR
jgi:thiamine pyrophosphate-dependent acetolactate synthase large subunit-like protein